MDSYITKRLIDTNILLHLMKKNPILDKTNTRLIAYDVPITKTTSSMNITSKLEKKIEKMKDNMLYEMTPSIINGLLFISICLIIYFVLYYKYNKKKNSMLNVNNTMKNEIIRNNIIKNSILKNKMNMYKLYNNKTI